MALPQRIRKNKRLIFIIAGILAALFLFFLIFVDRLVEPILRKRLHTLIIKGSDSLYTYQLGDLKANILGGTVVVENLQINIDSNRYEVLLKQNALPALTMELMLEKGEIRGISVIALVFNKKVRIREIVSEAADLKVSRHVQLEQDDKVNKPLWKSLQPDIDGIYVNRIKFDGIKFLYRNADTSESVKLQFDRCDALFKDIAVDSSSASDTNRIGFTRDIFMKFHDLKFRTQDSTYKMKAEWITYSSSNKSFEVDSFKLQPTLEKEDFYKANPVQTSLYNLEFVKARFRNLHLDRFLNSNIIEADSIFIDRPLIEVYNDKTMPPNFVSKVGQYPHQKLLKANESINIRQIAFKDGSISYTEKNEKTMQEGRIFFDNLNFEANNVTNKKALIKKDPVCRASVKGNILGAGQLNVDFRFFLDSLEGQYEASGWLKNIGVKELNPLAMALANVRVNSFDIHQLNFFVRGEDFEARSDVRMLYNNLSLTIRKTDEESGQTSVKKFITKILNKFVIWPDNPGADGVERRATDARALRLTSQSFFALFWKAIFAGMQDIIMKSGRYEG
ncbi:MAG: hypothetical protein ACXWB9_00835 [Flavisolibacter sp.]